MDMKLLQQMRTYYKTGATLPYDFRREQLQKLKDAIIKWEPELQQALHEDLHKCATESYLTEIGFTLSEISYALDNLSDWMQPKEVSSPITTFYSTSKMVRQPWGVGLIIAPWNYPVNLILGPLVGAMAGGNCAMLKPSELAPATADVIAQMIKETFAPEYINVVLGDGSKIVPELLNGFHFDHVFYTGSTHVGREIVKLTAPQFIPTVLEMGGKSPCIVDKDVNLEVAARRITWGKYTNAGQTCVAPDYLLVHESKKDKLLALIEKNITEFYTAAPHTSPDYGRIINSNRFEKLTSYLEQGKIMTGGGHTSADKYIAPTILTNVSLTQQVMQEEIFGPILPVIPYRTHDEAMEIISHNPDPLALYLFTNNSTLQERYINEVNFGGGCINNTLYHLGNPQLPFGGVGASGMGNYHGKYGFETYTRQKSIMKTATLPDLKIKYPPYGNELSLFKWVMK